MTPEEALRVTGRETNAWTDVHRWQGRMRADA